MGQEREQESPNKFEMTPDRFIAGVYMWGENGIDAYGLYKYKPSGLSVTTANRACHAFEDNGWAKSHPDPTDRSRRRILYSLTEEGKKQVAAYCAKVFIPNLLSAAPHFSEIAERMEEMGDTKAELVAQLGLVIKAFTSDSR